MLTHRRRQTSSTENGAVLHCTRIRAAFGRGQDDVIENDADNAPQPPVVPLFCFFSSFLVVTTHNEKPSFLPSHYS